MQQYTCPVCQGSLLIKRIDDGTITVRVDTTAKDGDLPFIELGNKSNGSIWVYCEKDDSHEIPQEFQDKLIDLFYEHY